MSIEFHWMQRNNWPNHEGGLLTMAKELEASNVTSVLLPYGPVGIDFSIYLPLIFKATKKIRMMLALPAYGVTPEYAAKTFETASIFGTNRVDLNLVAGKYEPEKFDYMMENYPGDTSLVDEHDKRVALTETWMEKFCNITKNHKPTYRLCVVGSSDTTMRIADNYTDYIIIGHYQLNEKFLPRLTNTKPILTIDPLIIYPDEDESQVKYRNYKYALPPKHLIRGTHDEVVQQLRDISTSFGVHDFMVITDQVDLSRIYKVIAELTNKGTN